MSRKFMLLLTTLLLALVLAACGGAATQPTAVQTSDQGGDIVLATTTEENAVSSTEQSAVSYPLTETGQTACYGADGAAIDCPAEGEALFGQDAQYTGNAMSYTDNGDGTVTDNVTGLTWQQTPTREHQNWEQATEYCASLELAGYDDWRVPSAKELFSLSDFSQGWPYINTDYFNLSDATVSKDEQYWTSNDYAGVTAEGRDEAVFGVNFGTGHIKAYPGDVTGPMAKRVRCVRGDEYGVNDFVDNGDGAITDNATGLMWAQDDSGQGMDWEQALAYVQQMNEENYLGYSDWRLPNVKELQSIVDYSRAPGASDPASEGPAIDPLFHISSITNEAGDADYPYFWTSTSARFEACGDYYYAWYVAFGRAVDGEGNDSHGAGAVRFDTKVEDGPLGEGGERYYNYVRLVRGGDVTETSAGAPTNATCDNSNVTVLGAPQGQGGQPQGQAQPAGQQDQPGGQPPQIDLAAAAAKLGVSEEALQAALGDPTQGPPDFAAAAAALGVSESDLMDALGIPANGMPPTEGAQPTQTEDQGTATPPVQSSSTDGDSFDTTAGIQAAQWGDNVTITLGEDTFGYQSNGLPNHDLPEKFLIPKDVGSQPFSDDALEDFNVVTTSEYLTESPIDVTLTLHPTYADEVQQTNLGSIGYIISGARLFNDYEDMDLSIVALDDNISFDFDDSGHDHAAFVDECNGHPLADGSNYHYHGVPTCITEEVDVAGEHSHMLGVLRDGFPVYGPQGEDGVLMTNAELDACSGHFGATPEFPDGIYHYHLTEDGAPYSIDCFKGVVDASTGDTGGPAGGPNQGGQPPRIDLAAAAQTLGVTEEVLQAALGDPTQGPPNFAAAAQALGVSESDLIDALGIPAGGPQGGPPQGGQPPADRP